MRVLAVDPGKVSGVVVLEARGRDDESEGAGALFSVETYEQLELPDVVWYLQEKVAAADVVVCERYVITANTAKLSRQYDGLYVIGGLLFLCELVGRPIELQSAADAKTMFSDEIMKTTGWFNAVKGDHARDALRHGLVWITRHGAELLV